jgi:RNAse (barnase) inhibitor barstar
MDWKRLLADAGSAAVIRADCAPGGPPAAAAVARDLGYFCVRFEGTAIPNKKALLSRMAEGLRFPSYFGNNWDALKDCLTDLDDWLPAPGYLLVFSSSGELCREAPQEAAVLMDVLESAAGFWRQQDPPRPFKVILG